MDREELKANCRKIMIAHLTSKGFPKMTRREILNELAPMWKKLDEAELMDELKVQGCSFQQFHDLAVRVAQESELLERFSRAGNIYKRNKP